MEVWFGERKPEIGEWSLLTDENPGECDSSSRDLKAWD
jgi:hypothetical protein